MSDVNRNCLSYWFPKLLETGVPVPATVIVKTECKLLQLLDAETPDGFDNFVRQLRYATGKVSGCPCFLRTGHTSGKHCWNKTCYLGDPGDIGQHVFNLVEESEMDIVGLPIDIWAVRELLLTQPICELSRYGGMPLIQEFRCFVRGGEVLCMHPYWPWEDVKNGFKWLDTDVTLPSDLSVEWERMCHLDVDDTKTVRDIASRASQPFSDEWSMDVLWTTRGWYVIDMALAKDSWHWPTCERLQPTPSHQAT